MRKLAERDLDGTRSIFDGLRPDEVARKEKLYRRYMGRGTLVSKGMSALDRTTARYKKLPEGFNHAYAGEVIAYILGRNMWNDISGSEASNLVRFAKETNCPGPIIRKIDEIESRVDSQIPVAGGIVSHNNYRTAARLVREGLRYRILGPEYVKRQ